MMLNLIVERFWNEGYRAPALTYTGEMIKIATPLLEAAREANLPVPQYTALEMAPLTVADIRSGGFVDGECGEVIEGLNVWLEQRYGHLVGDELLNLIVENKEQLAQEIVNGELGNVRAAKELDGTAIYHNGVIRMQAIKVDAVKATSFGTREDLERDRKFIARSNYATSINFLASQEFEIRHHEVIAWVRDRVMGNMGTILPMFCQDEIWVPCAQRNTFDDGAESPRDTKTSRRLFMTTYDISNLSTSRERIASSSNSKSIGRLAFGGTKIGSRYQCFQSEAGASWLIKFWPETTEELALLCGCMIADLPDVLQHWTLFRKYIGNSILDRIDPLAWKVRDPWIKLQFQMSFFVSKSRMKAIRAEYQAKA